MIPDAPVPGTMGDMQDEGIKDRVPGVGALEDDAADDATGSAADHDAGDDAAADAAAVDDAGDDAKFGGHRATRFGADVHYEGRRDDHEYIAQVRHRFLDTDVVLLIDGVRHDPASEKALAKKDDAQDVNTADGLALKLEEGMFRHTITVRRPTAQGRMKDSEKIVVRTTTLGGAGEVDVVRADELVGAPLVPAEGTSSAAREARKAAHPVRFGLIAAGAQAARFVVPLLGLGALFSGLLDPVKRWLSRRAEPVLTWLDESTRGIRTWIDEVTRPVRDAIDAVLDPIRRFVGWLWNLLFGWIPDIHLGIDLPDWIVDYLVPVLVVVVVFLITVGTIRDRRARMERARRGEDPTRPDDGERGSEGKGGSQQDGDDEDRSEGDDGDEREDEDHEQR
jgi:hypothetical protein